MARKLATLARRRCARDTAATMLVTTAAASADSGRRAFAWIADGRARLPAAGPGAAARARRRGAHRCAAMQRTAARQRARPASEGSSVHCGRRPFDSGARAADRRERQPHRRLRVHDRRQVGAAERERERRDAHVRGRRSRDPATKHTIFRARGAQAGFGGGGFGGGGGGARRPGTTMASTPTRAAWCSASAGDASSRS